MDQNIFRGPMEIFLGVSPLVAPMPVNGIKSTFQVISITIISKYVPIVTRACHHRSDIEFSWRIQEVT